jgi:hypothetical protein
MTKIITEVFVATALLATAIAASPALAQNRAPIQGEQYNGTYHGQPMSEWTRPDSW